MFCPLSHFCSNICLLCHHHVQPQTEEQTFGSFKNRRCCIFRHFIKDIGLKFWDCFLFCCLKHLSTGMNRGPKLDSTFQSCNLFFWNRGRKETPILVSLPPDFYLAKRVPSIVEEHLAALLERQRCEWMDTRGLTHFLGTINISICILCGWIVEVLLIPLVQSIPQGTVEKSQRY